MPTPNLDDFAQFAAVAAAGGFRAAAQARNLSASSLSEAVRRLESDLNVRLLNRTTRSVTPTEAGQRLLDRLTPALAELEHAADDLIAESDRPTGTLRLNVPVIVAMHILPPIAARFLAAHPGIRMEVTSQDIFVDVVAAGFDAGIRYEESVDRDMIAMPIGPRRQRYVCAASPHYLARHGTPTHPRDLAGHARLGHRFSSGRVSVWEFERGAQRFRIAPDGPLISNSPEMEVAATLAGLGIYASFREFLGPHLESGALVEILADWQEDFAGPLLYYHSRRLMPAPLRAFIDFVRTERPRETHE
jgi:DNA-binding transcriptional LysR family regulator